MMRATAPIEILKVRNTLGEGILWDWRRQLLWWTDIPNRTLYRYDWNRGTTRTLETPERVGSFGFIKGSDRLIVAFASGIASYDPPLRAVDWIARPEEIAPGIRFNDGRVDRRGRFWSGTMVEGGSHADRRPVCIPWRRARRLAPPLQRHCHFQWALPEPGRQAAVFRRFTDPHHSGIRDDRAGGSIWGRRDCSRKPPTARPRRRGNRCRTAACGARIGAAGASCAILPTAGSTVPCPYRRASPAAFVSPAPISTSFASRAHARDSMRRALRDDPNAGDVFFYRTGVSGLREPEYIS